MSDSTESEVLRALLPQFEEEGYEVYVHPNRTLLPSFLKGYVPDAIALRNDKNIAIEIALRKTPQKAETIERLTQMFEGQEKWQFRVYWGSPTEPQTALESQAKEVIRDRIGEVRELRTKRSYGAALLMGWAIFEAVARATMLEEFARPQSAGRLVEILARDGSITPTEADRLRVLAQKRNALIHGDLQVAVSDEEITNFVSVLETLLKQVVD